MSFSPDYDSPNIMGKTAHVPRRCVKHSINCRFSDIGGKKIKGEDEDLRVSSFTARHPYGTAGLARRIFLPLWVSAIPCRTS